MSIDLSALADLGRTIGNSPAVEDDVIESKMSRRVIVCDCLSLPVNGPPASGGPKAPHACLIVGPHTIPRADPYRNVIKELPFRDANALVPVFCGEKRQGDSIGPPVGWCGACSPRRRVS